MNLDVYLAHKFCEQGTIPECQCQQCREVLQVLQQVVGISRNGEGRFRSFFDLSLRPPRPSTVLNVSSVASCSLMPAYGKCKDARSRPREKILKEPANVVQCHRKFPSRSAATKGTGIVTPVHDKLSRKRRSNWLML